MANRGARIESLKNVVLLVIPPQTLQTTTLPFRQAFSRMQQRHFQDFAFFGYDPNFDASSTPLTVSPLFSSEPDASPAPMASQ